MFSIYLLVVLLPLLLSTKKSRVDASSADDQTDRQTDTDWTDRQTQTGQTDISQPASLIGQNQREWMV